MLQSPEFIATAPALDSLIWLPAKAAMGDLGALAVVAAIGLGALAIVIALTHWAFPKPRPDFEGGEIAEIAPARRAAAHREDMAEAA